MRTIRCSVGLPMAFSVVPRIIVITKTPQTTARFFATQHPLSVQAYRRRSSLTEARGGVRDLNLRGDGHGKAVTVPPQSPAKVLPSPGKSGYWTCDFGQFQSS